MRWTDTDKKRVRAVLDHITSGTTQAEFARALGLENRATLNNWRRRGKVPVEMIPAIIRAAAPGLIVTPGQLHPHGRVIEKQVKEQTK